MRFIALGKVFSQDPTIAGNYSICTENLSKGTKTLTLYFTINPELSTSSAGSRVEQLNEKVRSLYFTLNDISTNIEKLRTRETVHYESILINKCDSDKGEQ